MKGKATNKNLAKGHGVKPLKKSQILISDSAVVPNEDKEVLRAINAQKDDRRKQDKEHRMQRA